MGAGATALLGPKMFRISPDDPLISRYIEVYKASAEEFLQVAGGELSACPACPSRPHIIITTSPMVNTNSQAPPISWLSPFSPLPLPEHGSSPEGACPSPQLVVVVGGSVTCPIGGTGSCFHLIRGRGKKTALLLNYSPSSYLSVGYLPPVDCRLLF